MLENRQRRHHASDVPQWPPNGGKLGLLSERAGYRRTCVAIVAATAAEPASTSLRVGFRDMSGLYSWIRAWLRRLCRPTSAA
jgi:hypothetical protein